MSEFFLCEIENIEKSGVEIKVTGTKLKKDDDDCIRTVRTVCFDFSEHDKVFEDKIAELEKRIQELDTIDAIRIDEKRELKQRIAELESFSVQAEQDSTSLVFDLQKKIKSLQEVNDKLYNQLMENEKDYQEELEKMNRLVSDLYNQAQKETKKDFEPSSEWYENRHQSDCIEINRLNTTIDVLIHKVEYLRQFVGLE